MNFPLDSETHNIFDNLFAFFGTLDLNGFIIHLEGKIFEKFGVDFHTLSGQKFSEMVLRQNLNKNAGIIEKTIAEASVKNSSVYLDFKAGAEEDILVLLQLQPVFDKENNLKYIFVCGQEVTGDDKRILIGQIPAPDYKLDPKAGREIEKANRDRDFFLAFLSHELRSPLNTVLGWTKILLTKEINEAARKTALETIEKSARAQAKLIDDLVDSARISSGKLRLELFEINLFEILKKVYEMQKQLADAKNVSLEFISDKEDILVVGDSPRLQQMVTILVANALKLTKSGGYIKIRLEATENEAAIIVEDNGQGIDPDFLPGVFELFQQNDEKKPFNTGALGLSIVKILAEKHAGRVQATSAGIGCGSTFTVRLPLSDSKSKAESEIEKSSSTTFRCLDESSILIVKNDSDSRKVLQ